MPLPRTVTVGPLAAAVADYFAVSATPVSGTALTLAHTSVATARRVLLTYGNEGSARTLRLTGTNSDGNPIRETLAVPSGAGGTVYTVQDFLTLTEAMPLGGGWTAAMTLGTNGVASSPWGQSNQLDTPVNIGLACIVSGTVNYSIEYTYDNLNSNANQMGGALGNYPAVPNVFSHAVLVSKTSSDDGFINDPIFAWRLTVNSGATGSDSVTATAIQAGRP